MICKPCAGAADSTGEISRQEGHQRCEGGCPCQHRGTVAERNPGAAPKRADSRAPYTQS